MPCSRAVPMRRSIRIVASPLPCHSSLTATAHSQLSPSRLALYRQTPISRFSDPSPMVAMKATPRTNSGWVNCFSKSALGVLIVPRKRYRRDWGERRSMKSRSNSSSVALIGRINTVVPSRSFSNDSGFAQLAAGAWGSDDDLVTAFDLCSGNPHRTFGWTRQV